MFSGPVKYIDEEKFCEEYEKADKKLNESEDYDSAINLIRLNSEEYKAFGILRQQISSINYSEQISLTQEIIRSNPNSFCAWQHRMHLLLRTDSLGKSVFTAGTSDLEFIHSVLQTNPRNFHLWVYISLIYRYSEDIIHEQLSKCISNYSAYFGLIETQAFEKISETEMKNIIFTDPEISSPFVFIRMMEISKRLNRNNAFLMVYPGKMDIYLGVSNKTRVYLECNEKTTEYLADFKKIITINLSKEMKFEDISSFIIKTKGQRPVKIDLKNEYIPEVPAYINEFLSKYESVNALMTKLLFTISDTERRSVIESLLKLDPHRNQMYLELKQGYKIFRGN
ncbi:hypothetical protein NEAUS03_1376 [Nematocida ausubeli]|nr:hypothetical protein NEAUS03_1376 [Nematocida ausubeli]